MVGLWVIIICCLAEDVRSYKYVDEKVECLRRDMPVKVQAIPGEGLYWPCPNFECSNETDHSLIHWFKNTSGTIQRITAAEHERVHHHGPFLYILPLTKNDSGFYFTRRWELNMTGCEEFETELVVGEKFYAENEENSENVLLVCPVDILCPANDQTKNLTWYKDSHLIPSQSEKNLFLRGTSEKDKGTYTCVCTWMHHDRIYNTSYFIHLQIKEPPVSFTPTIFHPKNNTVEFIDMGSEVVLKCSVLFGINVKEHCSVSWHWNNTKLEGVEGYTIHTRNEDGTFHSTLTISKVSKVDLQSEFKCKATNLHTLVNVIITLKARESVLPLVLAFISAVLFILLAAGTIKWFAVDLALFFRGMCFKRTKKEDGKVYDAYVIYQKDNTDEKTERMAAHFINRVLPDVLENRCGFKLYIHSRDDLPGEDCLELVERIIKLSRRLIVVLTPEITHEQQLTAPRGYNWQVGLYQVLVQQDMSMILIQLGEIKDYSYLPLALRHHLRKSPPLKWREQSPWALSPSSRFWKQVRYMMPAAPAQLSPNSTSVKICSEDFSDTCC